MVRLVPQLKTKCTSKSGKSGQSRTSDSAKLIAGGVHDLIGRMQDYERAARKQGIDLASGRFKMLTNAECQFHRAELIADYIKLSISNLGRTQVQFESNLELFCAKVCDMQVPSVELMGTYLAAAQIASEEDRLNQMPGFDDAMRRTIATVLETCAEMIGSRGLKRAA
jgi:hypothetical protein